MPDNVPVTINRYGKAKIAFVRQGSLTISRAQFMSMGNVRFFHKLAEMRGQVRHPEPHRIEQIFGEDDIFKF